MDGNRKLASDGCCSSMGGRGVGGSWFSISHGISDDLNQIAVVSLAASHHQQCANRVLVNQFRARPSSSPAVPWLVLSRQHDATPVKITFGPLSELGSVARYWHNVGLGAERKSALLSASEYLEVARKALPSVGIVESMGQTGFLAWPAQQGPGGFISVSSAELSFPLRFVEDTTSSTMFACLDQSEPDLSWNALLDMMFDVKLLVLFLGSDLAESNGRLKMEFVRRVCEHNLQASKPGSGLGFILFLDGICISHLIHREIEQTFASNLLIPKLYATAFSCNLPNMQAAIKASLIKIVREDRA